MRIDDKEARAERLRLWRELDSGPDPMAEERAIERAARAAAAEASGGLTPRGTRKTRNTSGNTWVAALIAFVDGQAKLPADEKLTHPAFRVWICLHRHADGRNGMDVRVGSAEIGRSIGMSRKTVVRAVSELLRGGYLVRLNLGQKQQGVSRYRVIGVRN